MTQDRQIARWQEKATDADISAQLEQLVASADADAIEDAFYRSLEFGTGGLRGVLGPGTNRMNIYTVGQATQGLANYLNSLPGANKAVAIAHDSRINGVLFAQVVAEVLTANGIKAWLYPRLEPTPALSFATRYLHCDAGINITASHNPAQYNGYKVYGPDGCQITSDFAAGVQSAIDAVDIFDDVRREDFHNVIRNGQAAWMGEDVLDAFVDAVAAQGVEDPGARSTSLKVVYTPLNGTGLECVGRILRRIDVNDVQVVAEQQFPDGNFPTCPYPNPEMRPALELGINLCRDVHPDLLLATDPDADRVGVAVEDGDDYALITGNEMGALLLDYICHMRSATGTLPAQPVAITTIVSTDMVEPIAAHYGVEVRRVLTGFKYIGEQIGLLEAAGRPERFVFGFEESYGYLAGTHVRDKDAVVASMLICQMARYYRKRDMSLVDAMRALYEEYGYYRNATVSICKEGEDGAARIQQIMQTLRSQAPASVAGFPVREVLDYAPGIGGLPPANVMEFRLEGGNKMLVRPSGTEPKIKAYLFSVAPTANEAESVCAALADAANTILA